MRSNEEMYLPEVTAAFLVIVGEDITTFLESHNVYAHPSATATHIHQMNDPFMETSAFLQ